MRRLSAFEFLSLDGYYVDGDGEMQWAYEGPPDAEWDRFVAGNASQGSTLVFGRVTYAMMAGYWPTPLAMEQNPMVAKRMTALNKLVFSRSLDSVTWANTRLVKSDAVSEMQKLKRGSGEEMVILGSGSLVAQFTAAGLIDDFQLVMNPLALGQGRNLFQDLKQAHHMELTGTRAFKNGKVLLNYQALA